MPNPTTINDLECFVMSCGEPTVDECLARIEKQTYLPKRTTVIEGKTPLHESINALHEAMSLSIVVKVDADMMCKPRCFERLYTALRGSSKNYYASAGILIDPFLGRIGAIHMMQSKLVKSVQIPNIIGCDRWLRSHMLKLGYELLELKATCAEHWCDWSAKAVFARHVRVGQKDAYYSGKHYLTWISSLRDKWITTNNPACYLAFIGYCYGLLTQDSNEKHPDFINKEWGQIEDLMELGVIPKVKDKHLLVLKNGGNR